MFSNSFLLPWQNQRKRKFCNNLGAHTLSQDQQDVQRAFLAQIKENEHLKAQLLQYQIEEAKQRLEEAKAKLNLKGQEFKDPRAGHTPFFVRFCFPCIST